MLKSLPSTLEFSGEFGPELLLFVPFCRWLSATGLLEKRRIKTYAGMRCFYDDLNCRGILEKQASRTWIKPYKRPKWLPVRDEHTFDGIGSSPYHLYPDLRSKFERLPLVPNPSPEGKPILIVHNKHNNEWDMGPVNHISLKMLHRIFEELGQKFTIIYIRHGMDARQFGFSDDHNATLPFDERPVLAEFPSVQTFDELFAEHRRLGGTYDFNTFKNVLFSRCYHYISSQGGGAHHIAFYSGSLLAILHRRGHEERWAYGDGYYGFVAPVPPTRAICRTEDDLEAALELFKKSLVANDRVLVEPASAWLLDALSPWTIAQRTSSAFAHL